MCYTEYKGSMLLRNTGGNLQDHALSKARKPQSKYKIIKCLLKSKRTTNHMVTGFSVSWDQGWNRVDFRRFVSYDIQHFHVTYSFNYVDLSKFYSTRTKEEAIQSTILLLLQVWSFNNISSGFKTFKLLHQLQKRLVSENIKKHWI